MLFSIDVHVAQIFGDFVGLRFLILGCAGQIERDRVVVVLEIGGCCAFRSWLLGEEVHFEVLDVVGALNDEVGEGVELCLGIVFLCQQLLCLLFFKIGLLFCGWCVRSCFRLIVVWFPWNPWWIPILSVQVLTQPWLSSAFHSHFKGIVRALVGVHHRNLLFTLRRNIAAHVW